LEIRLVVGIKFVSLVDQLISKPTHSPLQGKIAFSKTDKVVFGTTNSASIPIIFP
jgi:hypothetical protein